MILEGIVEVVFPLIGRVLGYIIIEFLGQIVFYSSGYLTLKLIVLFWMKMMRMKHYLLEWILVFTIKTTTCLVGNHT